MKHLVFHILLLCLSATITFAKEPIRTMEAMVDRVLDGDTVSVVVKNGGGAKIKIRLYGIDAPETAKVGKKSGRVSKPGQPHGEEATQVLQSKVRDRVVVIKVYDVDRYRPFIR